MIGQNDSLLDSLPEGWRSFRIKDLTEKIGSGVTPPGGAASYQDDGIPFLRSQNIHFGGLRLDDVAFISDETHQEMAGTRLRENDVLLNITGASIGRCTFLPDGFGEGNVNQHGEDIEEFLKREIGKQIIRWQDSLQPGYEILPNKYFYKYQPPEPADKILQEFWRLEEEAEIIINKLGSFNE